MQLEGVSSEDFPGFSIKMGFELLPLMPSESSSYHKLMKTSHKDLFDRMLIWQAIQQDLILISKDGSIAQYKEAGLKMLW